SQSGDGISRYEEYRGFILMTSEGKGVHLRTDTQKKDVFVIDKSNLGPGYFTDLNLIIRWDPYTYEAEGHAVTRFFSSDKHAKTQYAITLIGDWDPHPDKEDYAGECFGSLNHPNVKAVIYLEHIKKRAQLVYGEQWEEYFEKQKPSAIAHELGHAVNLTHCEDDNCIMRGYWDILTFPNAYCSSCKAKIKLYTN
ncbi:MAG: hypothetical protein ACPLPS_11050, partial [bacterium]